ncbi:MAG: hypothetical protein IT440_14550 [Phycisphaeraceae bacterium]|nr:hypothetical protein [Phycisphaeraceae bacterium]
MDFKVQSVKWNSTGKVMARAEVACIMQEFDSAVECKPRVPKVRDGNLVRDDFGKQVYTDFPIGRVCRGTFVLQGILLNNDKGETMFLTDWSLSRADKNSILDLIAVKFPRTSGPAANQSADHGGDEPTQAELDDAAAAVASR